MSNLLKQFSIEEKDLKKPVESVEKDVLQKKYVNSPRTDASIAPKSIKKILKSDSKVKLQLHKINFSPKNYIFQLPTLFLGLIGYFISYNILQKVQPDAIKDILIHNSYIVLLITLGMGHFFTSWYLLQNLRRSVIFATCVTILLFLRIHQLGAPLFLLLVIFSFLFLELLLTYRSFRR